MNCSEAQALAPLWLSGEMDEPRRHGFQTHLESCPNCARMIDEHVFVDKRVLTAVSAEDYDSSRTERIVTQRIVSARRRGWAMWAGITAVLLAALFAGLRTRKSEPISSFYWEIARDHRVEVFERQPRRWRSETPEIEALAARFGLTAAKLFSLAPRGYRLVQAKTCGIDREPVLHMVFSNGSREFSLYLRQENIDSRSLRTMVVDGESLAAAGSQNYAVVVAASDLRTECGEIARSVARLL